MARYLFRAKVTQMTNLLSSPQTTNSENFGDFVILLDLSYNSGENELLFVKIGARVLDLLLDTSSGPKWHECSF